MPQDLQLELAQTLLQASSPSPPTRASLPFR